MIIDRFEGEYVLIQYKKRIFHIPKALLPKGVKPGDRIRMEISVENESPESKK